MNNIIFEKGKSYRNRLGSYVVLEILSNGKMTVQYTDGSQINQTHDLTISIQEKLVQNQQLQQRFNDDMGSLANILPSPKKQQPTAKPLPEIDWTIYDKWNDLIFLEYFESCEIWQDVYLDIDDEKIQELFYKGNFQNDSDYITECVQKTLEFDIARASLFIRHINRMDDWNKDNRKQPPPFLALLAVFCYTASKMQGSEDLSYLAYYPVLTELILGEKYTLADKTIRKNHEEHIRTGFEQAEKLWTNLIKWQNENSNVSISI